MIMTSTPAPSKAAPPVEPAGQLPEGTPHGKPSPTPKKSYDPSMEAVALQTACEAELTIFRTQVQHVVASAKDVITKYTGVAGTEKLVNMLQGRIAFAEARRQNKIGKGVQNENAKNKWFHMKMERREAWLDCAANPTSVECLKRFTAEQGNRHFIGCQSLMCWRDLMQTVDLLGNTARTEDDIKEAKVEDQQKQKKPLSDSDPSTGTDNKHRHPEVGWAEHQEVLRTMTASIKDGSNVLASTAKKVASQKAKADKLHDRAKAKADREAAEVEAGAPPPKKPRTSGAPAGAKFEDIFDGPMDSLPNFKAIVRVDAAQDNAGGDLKHSEPIIFTNATALTTLWQARSDSAANTVAEFRRRYPESAQYKSKGRASKATAEFQPLCEKMLETLCLPGDGDSLLLTGKGEATDPRSPGASGLTCGQLCVQHATARHAGWDFAYLGSLRYQIFGLRSVVCVRITEMARLLRASGMQLNLMNISQHLESLQKADFDKLGEGSDLVQVHCTSKVRSKRRQRKNNHKTKMKQHV